jgi:hypothetical protein
MRSASNFLTLVCVLLTALLWAVTLITDPTPSSMTAAAALTVIVGLMTALTSLR